MSGSLSGSLSRRRVDGGEGGTGAAPLPLMDLVGVTIKEALPEVANLLREYGLKDRIRLIASGKLMVPGDVAWALAVLISR